MINPITPKQKLHGFYESRQGGRSENQDYAGWIDTPLGALLIVCDGMGGMRGGSTASRLAVTTVLDFVSNCDPQDKAEMALVKAIKHANTVVFEAGQSDENLHGMGTTITALLMNPKAVTVAHVGDSRIYQLRKGRKVFRTFDHSMVFEMVKKKVITEEQARLSAQSNIIMRAMGIKPDLDVEVHTLPYRKGDRFLLCSDGFWGVLPEPAFLELVTGDGPIDKVLESSFATIEQTAQIKGGEYDNLTAALVEVGQKSTMRPPIPKKKAIIVATVLVALAALAVVLAKCLSSAPL